MCATQYNTVDIFVVCGDIWLSEESSTLSDVRKIFSQSQMERGFHIPSYAKPFEELHDAQLDHFWRPPGPSKFTKDRSQWEPLYYGVRRRLKGVVHVLTRMEPEVVENAEDIQSLCKKVIPENILVDLAIMNIMTDSFKAMEGIHIRSYGTIDSILPLELNDVDKEAFAKFIQSKVDVIAKWRSHGSDDLKYQLSRAILGNVFSEGLVFNTLFSVFSVPKKDGVLETTCLTNDEVLSDENIHTRGFITMYIVLVELGIIPRLSQQEVYDMLNDFIAVDDLCSEWLLGNMDEKEKEFFLVMTETNAKIYTRIVANYILKSLGYTPLFPYTKDDNPYPFIKQSLINTLGFFFDKTVVEYGLKVDHDYEEDSDLDDE